MVADSSLGAIIEGLEKIEALLWEEFLSNNRILSSKDLHDLGTNAGNPGYGGIVSQAGAISKQCRLQIEGIQQALQSPNLPDNRATELHTQLHQIGSERIEVIERFDRINQLSKGFHCIQAMQTAQNTKASPLLGIEAARQVFDGYSPTQQGAVRDVLEQARLQGWALQEKINKGTIFPKLGSEEERKNLSSDDKERLQTEHKNIRREVNLTFQAISDLCALSDATRPASMQENLGAMGERAGACMTALGHVVQTLNPFAHNNSRH